MSRTGIRGTQIKDETIESEDLASGSIKAGEMNAQAISSQTLITSTDTTNDRILIYDATDAALKQIAPENLGISIVGGSDTEVQFNDGGSSFGADSSLTFNKTTNTLTVAGPLTASNIAVGEYISHTADADTFIQFSDDQINIEAGEKQMIKLSQAGTNKIILNNGQTDVDLQVKSKGNANLFRTDAYNNSVYFGSNSGAGDDNNFWVSGSLKSKDSSTRGTAVFGGDLVVSGGLYDSKGSSYSTNSLQQLRGQVTLTDSESLTAWAIDTAIQSQIPTSDSGNINTWWFIPAGIRIEKVYVLVTSNIDNTNDGTVTLRMYNQQAYSLLSPNLTYTKDADDFSAISQTIGLSSHFLYKVGAFQIGADIASESLIQMTLEKSVTQTTNPSAQLIVVYATSLT